MQIKGPVFIFITGLFLAFHASVLYIMGRIFYCACGYIKLWHGVVYSSENSQHLTDWYTFSHIIHGFILYFIITRATARSDKKAIQNSNPRQFTAGKLIFYWIFKKLCPKFSFEVRCILAIIIEISWEILENSSIIIDRYRAATISLDYYGDSIINSTFDVLAMIFGFWLASKLPVWMTIALALIMEVAVGYYIHDSLTLNVLMLIYPLQAVKNWQVMQS